MCLPRTSAGRAILADENGTNHKPVHTPYLKRVLVFYGYPISHDPRVIVYGIGLYRKKVIQSDNRPSGQISVQGFCRDGKLYIHDALSLSNQLLNFFLRIQKKLGTVLAIKGANHFKHVSALQEYPLLLGLILPVFLYRQQLYWICFRAKWAQSLRRNLIPMMMLMGFRPGRSHRSFTVIWRVPITNPAGLDVIYIPFRRTFWALLTKYDVRKAIVSE